MANKKQLDTLTAEELMDLSLKGLARLRHTMEVASTVMADASPPQRAKFDALVTYILKRLQEHADVIDPRPIPPSRHARNTSGYIGVSYSKRTQKWKAGICINYKSIHLGLYDTPEEARKAYLIAKLQSTQGVLVCPMNL